MLQMPSLALAIHGPFLLVHYLLSVHYISLIVPKLVYIIFSSFDDYKRGSLLWRFCRGTSRLIVLEGASVMLDFGLRRCIYLVSNDIGSKLP